MSNTAHSAVLFCRNWYEIQNNHEVIFMNTKQTDRPPQLNIYMKPVEGSAVGNLNYGTGEMFGLQSVATYTSHIYLQSVATTPVPFVYSLWPHTPVTFAYSLWPHTQSHLPTVCGHIHQSHLPIVCGHIHQSHLPTICGHIHQSHLPTVCGHIHQYICLLRQLFKDAVNFLVFVPLVLRQSVI